MAAQSVTLQGPDSPITITPEKSSGLNAIFVLKSMEGASLHYKCKGSGEVKWYLYGNLGGGHAQEIDNFTTINGESILNNLSGDTGYIIEEGTDRYYLWLTDYSAHRLSMEGIDIGNEQDCGTAYISIKGHGAPIYYYTITGRQSTLSRDITITWHTQQWNEDNHEFITIEAEKVLEYISPTTIITPAPLCSTNFYASGDRFLQQWGEELTVQSGVYAPTSVEVHTQAEQLKEDIENSNEISSGDGLGGSAPAEITFTAYISDAVLHNEWQFSHDADFSNIQYRFSQQELSYTFTEEGTTYVRFIGSNADGSCEAESEVYTVSIGASELHCPNAFSPDASSGINDEWKVSFKSLITFKCWIFDRYGTQLFYFDDPLQGWDGKYKGKFVKPGVYYYVIEATGSDGKHYKKGGDINILRYRQARGAGSGE